MKREVEVENMCNKMLGDLFGILDFKIEICLGFGDSDFEFGVGNVRG